jgi:hypothetical protein
MDLFGNNSADYTNDAINAEQQAYGQSAQYLSPYTQNAGTDFNNARNALYTGARKFGSQPNYNQNFYKYLSMSPEQLFNQALSGYSESPFMADEMKYAESSANNQLISQGMGGSSENALLDAEIGNVLGGQDIQRYLSDIMKSFDTQESILHQYNKEAQDIGGLFQDMLSREFGASNQMSNNAMKEGQQESQAYEREGENERYRQSNMWNDLLKIPGDIWELDKIFSPATDAAGKVIGGATKAAAGFL